MKNGLYISESNRPSKKWYCNGKYHRLNGPAIVFSDTGYSGWYKNGKQHRLDGPAREWKNSFVEWWYEDQIIYCSNKQEFERLIKLRVFLDK